MKRTIFSLVVFTGMFGVGASNARAQSCSNASLRGTYGFHAFATIVSPGSPGTPRAIIGVFTLDGRGSYTSTLTMNDNGTITHPPTNGVTLTYVVNPDCTGTIFTGGAGTVEIVVVDGGREFYQMRTDPASIVVFGTTKKVSSGNNSDN